MEEKFSADLLKITTPRYLSFKYKMNENILLKLKDSEWVGYKL